MCHGMLPTDSVTQHGFILMAAIEHAVKNIMIPPMAICHSGSMQWPLAKSGLLNVQSTILSDLNWK